MTHILWLTVADGFFAHTFLGKKIYLENETDLKKDTPAEFQPTSETVGSYRCECTDGYEGDVTSR